MDAYLAQFRWQRRADQLGKVSLGRTDHYLGRAHKGRVWDITFDRTDRSFAFATPDGATSLRRPALGLGTHHILDITTGHARRLPNPEKAHRLQDYDK